MMWLNDNIDEAAPFTDHFFETESFTSTELHLIPDVFIDKTRLKNDVKQIKGLGERCKQCKFQVYVIEHIRY